MAAISPGYHPGRMAQKVLSTPEGLKLCHPSGVGRFWEQLTPGWYPGLIAETPPAYRTPAVVGGGTIKMCPTAYTHDFRAVRQQRFGCILSA
jgi:hypothetical protein